MAEFQTAVEMVFYNFFSWLNICANSRMLISELGISNNNWLFSSHFTVPPFNLQMNQYSM